MTQNIFNLYSAEAFAQHPMSLWSLDDDFSYVSLVSANPVYSIVGGFSASVANPPTQKPQETVGVADISLNIESFVGSASATTITTQSFVVPDDTDSEKPTVCINTFIYTYDTSISELHIGFEYGGSYYTRIYEDLELNTWTRITHTIPLPSSGTITPYINVVYEGTEKTFSLYQLSVGQWSEQYNHDSLGVVPVNISSISASSEVISSIGGAVSASPSLYKVIIADSYGLSDVDEGYYLIENNRMLATNSNLPMVYGSGDITEIHASSNSVPSIVFPGKGFMHSTGKYKNMTAEFFLKAFPKNSYSVKIFGPLTSNDGLYINKEFITLRIGPYEKSYFVNKWYRPMLIDIRYTETYISVLINGDLVIEQNLLSRDVEFPESSLYNNDWIGFYGHPEIHKIEVDCLAIYPYIVSEQLAKKKFVYAQGVGPANEITTKFGSTSLPIDFSFAKYAANIIYPDMTNWYAGFYSNMDATSQYLSLPNYSLPEIKYFGQDLSAFNVDRRRRTWQGIQGRTWFQWLSRIWRQISSAREIEPLFDNYAEQINREDNFYIRLKPISTYDNVYGSIIFNSLGVLTDPVASVFGVFSLNQSEVEESEVGKEIIIMHFINQQTNDVFKIIYDDVSKQIKYIYNTTTIKSMSFTPGESDTLFIAGIDINKITSSFATVIRRFFANQQNIIFSVGGYQDNQFTGKIYKVIFNNAFFTRKDLSLYFDATGISSFSGSAEITSSNEVLDYTGNYTLLFKKANSSMIMDVASVGYWEDSVPLSSLGTFTLTSKGKKVYDLDSIQFNIDYPASIIASDNFDTNDNLKTYVTLQKFEDVGKISYSNYTTTKQLDDKRYVDFENITTNIDSTKFRVVDGTVIFAPKTIISFDDAYITTHIELTSPGTNTSNLRVQRMSLASLAYDQSRLYPINTATGNKLYPFSRQNISYLNKAKNPFLIYKDSTPYLYLTGDSGIQAVPYPEIEDSASETFRRGISIPLNQGRKEDYLVYGVHLWMFYNKDTQFSIKERVFSISYGTQRYNIYLEPESGNKRAKLVGYEYDINSETQTNKIVFYQNGIKKVPHLLPLSWSLITIRFDEPINLSSILGQFEVHPGILFNNFVIYEQDIDKLVDDIFESHLGLSNIVSDDSSTLSVNFDEVNIFSSIRWTTFSGKPV